jgi:hypothetical protein
MPTGAQIPFPARSKNVRCATPCRTLCNTCATPASHPARLATAKLLGDNTWWVVSAEGFEPSTHALKGHCSTN